LHYPASTATYRVESMPRLLLFNKPFQVISQFSPEGDKVTLADFIRQPGFYPAGRLDYDSEGLLLLTDDGSLQTRIADPRWKLPKTYWAQVEGEISDDALARLCAGVELNDGPTLPAQARRLEKPALWERNPPIRQRAAIPVSWLELIINEGRNRQVRRMTAAVGFPTLRLVRVAIGDWKVEGLQPGELKMVDEPWEQVPGGQPMPRPASTPLRPDRTPSPRPTAADHSPTPFSRKERASSGSPSGRTPQRKPPADGQR